MTSRRIIVAFVVVAGLGFAGLLAASLTGQRATSFSVNVPAVRLLRPLGAGQTLCQQPIRASSPIGGVRLWIWPGKRPTPPSSVTVHDASSGALLATGLMSAVPARPATDPRNWIPLYPTPVSRTTVLTTPIPSGKRISVCLHNHGPSSTTVLGSGTNPLSGSLTIADKPTTQAAALLFLEPHDRSLLSLVPTALRRAALFRPGWVGAWTFWALGVALLLGFGVLGFAVVWAARDDTREDGGQTGPQGA